MPNKFWSIFNDYKWIFLGISGAGTFITGIESILNAFRWILNYFGLISTGIITIMAIVFYFMWVQIKQLKAELVAKSDENESLKSKLLKQIYDNMEYVGKQRETESKTPRVEGLAASVERFFANRKD